MTDDNQALAEREIFLNALKDYQEFYKAPHNFGRHDPDNKVLRLLYSIEVAASKSNRLPRRETAIAAIKLRGLISDMAGYSYDPEKGPFDLFVDRPDSFKESERVIAFGLDKRNLDDARIAAFTARLDSYAPRDERSIQKEITKLWPDSEEAKKFIAQLAREKAHRQKNATAEQASFLEINNVFLARREIFFNALKKYHDHSHQHQSPDEKIRELMATINKLAQESDRLPKRHMAKIAVEWDKFLRQKAKYNAATGHFGDPDQVLAFVEDKGVSADRGVIELVKTRNFPNLPKNYDFMVSLDAISHSPSMQTGLGFKVALEQVKAANKQDVPSGLDLIELRNLSAPFDDALSSKRTFIEGHYEKTVDPFIDCSSDSKRMANYDGNNPASRKQETTPTTVFNRLNPSEEEIIRKLAEWAGAVSQQRKTEDGRDTMRTTSDGKHPSGLPLLPPVENGTGKGLRSSGRKP